MSSYRICSICEAACGLEVDVDGRTVVGVRANEGDVFSTGHVCAKGIALQELDADPDRIRTPLLQKNGQLQPATWPDALAYIAERLKSVREAGGDNSVGTYIGNPTAHNIGLAMGMNSFLASLGSTQVYSAGTVDQVPKQLASALMFGNDLAIPVPDIERCDLLLMLGANPVVSNGSLWVVPKVRDKLRALRDRGGRLVTVDPRRSETARLANEHHFITPGTDSWLLVALINELLVHGRDFPVQLAEAKVRGADKLQELLSGFSLTEAAKRTGIAEQAIQALAQQLHEAKHPVLYGRVGTTLQQFGTLTSFLIEVINLQIGALDQQGGAMFPEQPYHVTRPSGDVLSQGRWHTRITGQPEVLGQLPVTALADEILEQGAGQVRALFCFAGNPVVSTPDSERLQQAFEDLELLVSVDIYHSETSKLADVVLPGTSPFEESHYDQFLGSMGYKNAARYSPPVFAAEQPDEWDIGLTLGYIAANDQVPDAVELANFEDTVVAAAINSLVEDTESGIAGADPQKIMALIEPERGVERLLDLHIRAGRWGDHFGKRTGLTLKQLASTPDGIDLGALRADRLNEINGFADRRLELAPQLIVEELDGLAKGAETELETTDSLQLIGRRNARSNNSWLRNLPMLGAGKPLCVLHMHPQDAQPRSILSGDRVNLVSNTGSVTVAVELDEALMPGVVSLPHGFSMIDDLAQENLQVGANYNVLAAASAFDVPSGTAALNGIQVVVEKSAGQI